MTDDARVISRYGPLSAVAGIRLVWILAIALVGAAFPLESLPVTVVVVLYGTFIVWRGMSRNAGADADADAHPAVVHVITWATLFVLFCLWELAAFLLGNDEQHATFSTVMSPVIATYPGRVMLWIGWLSVGDWLSRR